MAAIEKPLTNLQLELLQLYSMNVSEEDLLAIRRLIARYFADKASDEMDRLWEENKWSDETMDEWVRQQEEDPILGYDADGTPRSASELTAMLDAEVEAARRGNYKTIEDFKRESEQ